MNEAQALRISRQLESATIELIVEQDQESHIDHFATDEPELDRQLEREISERLDRGDIWAWCCVKVVATLEIDDTQYRGESDWLGGCCYKDERDFREPGDYFTDMKDTALNALADQLMSRPLDPGDIAITTDAQRLALADLVNRALKYRSREIESIRAQLLNILKPA
jgi:hypothetical protein